MSINDSFDFGKASESFCFLVVASRRLPSAERNGFLAATDRLRGLLSDRRLDNAHRLLGLAQCMSGVYAVAERQQAPDLLAVGKELEDLRDEFQSRVPSWLEQAFATPEMTLPVSPQSVQVLAEHVVGIILEAQSRQLSGDLAGLAGTRRALEVFEFSMRILRQAFPESADQQLGLSARMSLFSSYCSVIPLETPLSTPSAELYQRTLAWVLPLLSKALNRSGKALV